MTIGELKTIARQALDDIRRMQKGHVYASRKGIFAAHRSQNRVAGFRRQGTNVQLEIWPATGNKSVTRRDLLCYKLPKDLERQAGEMLDNL